MTFEVWSFKEAIPKQDLGQLRPFFCKLHVWWLQREGLGTNLSGAGGGRAAVWPGSGSASGHLWTGSASSACRHLRTSPSLGCFWWTLGNVTRGQIWSSCNLPAASFSAGNKPSGGVSDSPTEGPRGVCWETHHAGGGGREGGWGAEGSGLRHCPSKTN